MSIAIPIGDWVNLLGGGGSVEIRGMGGSEKETVSRF